MHISMERGLAGSWVGCWPKIDEVAACKVGKLGSGGGGMCGACMMRWIGCMSREIDSGDELFMYYRFLMAYLGFTDSVTCMGNDPSLSGRYNASGLPFSRSKHMVS